ncbi:MAG: hypothetical protein COV66_12565 [Nitrospinae bacterium CG11_big_fil_rev_8_21_14_0_20_45_15]|nr:MAG: hypothetical protein COV66_12565 [Nitrospinae bacterium CG11_big_fil_rev_8_21_14_0_20_45_15]
MANELSIKLNQKITADLIQKFNGNQEDIEKFVHHCIEQSLAESINTDPPTPESLEDYLKSGSKGSRAYGLKGQGW